MNSLLVLYGLRTDDYGWLSRFYPVQRIGEACKKEGIPVRFLFPRDFTGCTAPGEAVLVRGTVGDSSWDMLERLHVPHVNSRNACRTADSKYVMYRFLSEHGFPVPRTFVTVRAGEGIRFEPVAAPGTQRETDASGIAALLPLVAKPEYGSGGRGVTLIETERQLDRFLHRIRGKTDEIWLFQEYVAFAPGTDIRAFFAGGTVIAVAQRRAGRGILSNVRRGGTVKKAEIDPAYRRMVLDIAEKAGLFYGTVDFLYRGPEELTVCEINASPGFEGLEKGTGIPVAEPLVRAAARFL